MVEDMWDYSCTVLIKGFPLPCSPFSLDALGVVISDRWLDADTHLHFCARTDFLLSDTFRPCSGILFINLSALVGDLESVSSHKDVVIKIN